MFAEFKHTLRGMRGSIIGWGIGLALYGLMMAALYQSVVGMGDVAELLKSYPKEMTAFFKGMMEMNTPKGYMDTYYFSLMPLIVGIFAVGAGAALVAGDEEKGTLDLVMAHPISRPALFWGRMLALAAAIGLILILGWVGWLYPSGMGLNVFELLLPFVPLLAVLLLFGALALLFSLLFPASRLGGMLSGALLVLSYLILGLANLSPKLEPFVKLTPYYYYQGADVLVSVNWAWLGGLLGVAALFAVGAWALFQRRDIRVSGERNWRLPGLKVRR